MGNEQRMVELEFRQFRQGNGAFCRSDVVKALASFPKQPTGRFGSLVSGVSIPMSRTRSPPATSMVSPSITRATATSTPAGSEPSAAEAVGSGGPPCPQPVATTSTRARAMAPIPAGRRRCIPGALGQAAPLRHDDDVVAEAGDHVHLVLDQEQGDA